MSQGVSVTSLKCESKSNPLGIEEGSPRLSWALNSTDRGVMQTAYRILVSDNEESLVKNIGNIWDSEKTTSDQSIQVKYQGKKLEPAKGYLWKVMVWDNKNHFSKWSKIASWQIGLLSKEDWINAQWIAYEKIPDSLMNPLPTDGKKDTYKGNNILPLLRKSFDIKKRVKKATMFICGLGQFEMSINGKKIGDHFLDPGWTKYDKQALYVPFDVTNNLKTGENAIGVMLGNGFYYIPPVSGRYRKLKVAFGYPKMICRLLVEFNDGTVQNVISDTSWKTTPGPITFSSIYGGEDYDATIEQKGWDLPGFKLDWWKQAIIVDGPPILNAQLSDPVKIVKDFSVVKINSLGSASRIYDFGQNASGIIQIKVSGKKGDTVRITPAELLKGDSGVNQRASGSPFYFQYILKGDGVETWQPRFTYYGFRYVQIDGTVTSGDVNPKHLPVLIDLEALHIRNGAKKIGSFQSSSNLFNQTFNLISWAVESNMVSLFTDCPHREKLGWLEQAHLMGNALRYNYDVISLYRKQIQDMKYSQTSEGLVPEIAPEYVKFDWGDGMFRDSPEWGSNSIITPWDLYKWYGDTAILESSYTMMKGYINYLQSKAKGNILSQGLGDWYDLGPKPPGVSQLTPMGVTATAIYFYDLNILSEVAGLLNKKDDSIRYKELSVAVKRSFNDLFFHKDTKQYGSGSQTANAMAVFMDLVQDEDKQYVIENIVKDIRDRNNSLTAGDIGYHYLLSVLHQAGRDDVIFDMNSRTDVPGYGYQLTKGATALTESWQALSTSSNNHFMLGHIMEWFYTGLAGINQSDSSIGFKRIVIDPRPVGDLNFVEAEVESPRGKILSSWKKDGESFLLRIFIPHNATATVYLPSTSSSIISENGHPLKENKNVSVLGFENGKTKLVVGSGAYEFKVK